MNCFPYLLESTDDVYWFYAQSKVPAFTGHLSRNSGKPHGQNEYRIKTRKQNLSPPTRHENAPVSTQGLCLVRVFYMRFSSTCATHRRTGQKMDRFPNKFLPPPDSPWDRPCFNSIFQDNSTCAVLWCARHGNVPLPIDACLSKCEPTGSSESLRWTAFNRPRPISSSNCFMYFSQPSEKHPEKKKLAANTFRNSFLPVSFLPVWWRQRKCTVKRNYPGRRCCCPPRTRGTYPSTRRAGCRSPARPPGRWCLWARPVFHRPCSPACTWSPGGEWRCVSSTGPRAPTRRSAWCTRSRCSCRTSSRGECCNTWCRDDHSGSVRPPTQQKNNK